LCKIGEKNITNILNKLKNFIFMSDLSEIINQEQIKLILDQYTGERQLVELKFYLLTFNEELRELGIDASRLAWQIYTTNRK
jgi:hypothetical protein